MDEEDFNFYRLWKIGNNASLPALTELFETLWERKHPETPWTKDAASVNLFEQKEEESFQKSIEKLSNNEKKRKIYSRLQRQSTFRESNWTNYDWDISKVVYALVDSKLFDLTIADTDGVQVSEHVVMIKSIRNETAHSKRANYSTTYFEKTVKALNTHIKALELVGIDFSEYIDKLQTIYAETPPVSSQEVSKLQQECEKLKNLQQINEEKEKRCMLLEQKIADNESFNAKFDKLTSEKDSVIEKIIDDIKTKHSAEIVVLKSENCSLKEEIADWNKKHATEFQKLKSDYDHLEKVTEDLNKMHSVKLDSLQLENNYLKTIIDSTNTLHSDELENLRSQIDTLKQSVESISVMAHGRPTSHEIQEDIPVTKLYHSLDWYLAYVVVFLTFLPTAGSHATKKPLSMDKL